MTKFDCKKTVKAIICVLAFTVVGLLSGCLDLAILTVGTTGTVDQPKLIELSISLKETGPNSRYGEIPYGGSATVRVTARMNVSAYHKVSIELWEYDAYTRDDLLASAQTFTTRLEMKEGFYDFTISCTNKGELLGDGEADADDEQDGEVRKYDIYARAC